jgi:hypothetical protein
MGNTEGSLGCLFLFLPPRNRNPALNQNQP